MSSAFVWSAVVGRAKEQVLWAGGFLPSDCGGLCSSRAVACVAIGIRNQLFYLCHSLIGVWAHGDYCKINPNTGGIVMLGRRYSILVQVFRINNCQNLQMSL